MWFELWNAATEGIPHCGALEFITEGGMVYIPYWVLMECSCRSINILQYVLLTLYYDLFWKKKLLLILNFEKKRFIYSIILLKNDFFGLFLVDLESYIFLYIEAHLNDCFLEKDFINNINICKKKFINNIVVSKIDISVFFLANLVKLYFFYIRAH